jgi:DNA-binding NtrC family response regulator
MTRTVLLAEDEAALRAGFTRILERRGLHVEAVSTGEDALRVIGDVPVDLLVSDIQMPGMGGLKLLTEVRQAHPLVPVIVISGTATLEDAATAIKLGAIDFLQKPIAPERLVLTVEHALRLEDLKVRNSALERSAGTGAALVGESPAMLRLGELLRKVGPTDGRVLILGENGTGKELVATAIHRGSRRSEGPLVKLNCAAVPGELIESELFGHEKGAFTGALRARRGRFEEASGGTLFLDEVGDMSLAMQAKLLRVLQEGQLERVGGGRTIQVDVRVIAATNRDLAAMVERGQFREDLYYRLNVVTLRVPPLRERAEDIPLLAQTFARQIAERMGRRPIQLDDAVLGALSRHTYPGNVRELMNMIERLTILADGDRVNASDVLGSAPSPPGAASLYRADTPFRDLMHEAERRILVAAIEAHDGNKSATARSLAIDRSHFFKKCRELGIGGEDG